MARCFFSALIVCTAVMADNRDKYLAAAGPTPLRFRTEVPEFNPAWLLPALDMGDAKPEPAKTTEDPKAVKETKTESQPQQNAEPEPIVIPDEITLTVPEAEQPSTSVEPPQKQSSAGPISPQMLLRYFSRNGTNEVLVPYNLEFTPPVKGTGSSGGSSAIYISE